MKLSAPLRRLARAAAMLSLAALGWGAVPALAREGGAGLSASAEAIARQLSMRPLLARCEVFNARMGDDAPSS